MHRREHQRWHRYRSKRKRRDVGLPPRVAPTRNTDTQTRNSPPRFIRSRAEDPNSWLQLPTAPAGEGAVQRSVYKTRSNLPSLFLQS